MRILQLCTKVPYPPKDGGAEGIFVFTNAFAMLGHNVDVLAVNPPKHFVSEPEFSDLPAQIRIYPFSMDTGVCWYKALWNLFFSAFPYHIERFIHKGFTSRLKELLNQSKPDVVQLEGIYLCPYIPVIKKFGKARIILRAHNVEHILWHNIAENEPNWLKKQYLKIQARRLKEYEIKQIQQVDGVTTVTENDFNILKSYRSNLNIKVIPFGVQLNNNSPCDTLNLNDLFFLGALDWMPNQEAIQWFVGEVWPGMHERLNSISLHIAGRNAPQWLANYLRSHKGVIFHGEIPDAQDFINKFTIMIVPLFSGSGIRVKIIDAMLQGKVVIASSKAIDGIPAVPGQHFLLANKVIDYLDQVTLILSNANLVKEISYNAKALIREKFNILAIASELIDFYNKTKND